MTNRSRKQFVNQLTLTVPDNQSLTWNQKVIYLFNIWLKRTCEPDTWPWPCNYCLQILEFLHIVYSYCIIPVNPPPFRGSLPRKSLISRMDWVSCAGDINFSYTPFAPARSPSNKKIKYNKILTYILRSIFLEIPHLELPRWWKMQRDTNGKGV